MILSSELSLGALLERIVQVAVELTLARYGALGVIDDAGVGLSDFITTGVTDDERTAIGHLPEGHGILGLLIREQHSLRLSEIAADPRSVGFPPHHPPMHSFLGAPVRARGRVFGNIYLTEKRGEAEFTAEDEETLNVLATQAGVAIENARLVEDSALRARSLEAMGEISAAILRDEDADRLLRQVVLRAMELAGGDAASAVLPVPGGDLRLVAAAGEHAQELEGMNVPREGSASGQVIASGRPMVLVDASADPRVHKPAAVIGNSGPGILVPLPGRDAVIGALTVTRLNGGRPFEPRDLTLLGTFAAQAALALEYSRAQHGLRRLALLGDRERIARELHDGVIQSLFAVGLGLQGTTALVQDGVTTARLQQAITEIDRVIGDLRSYIFGLRPDVLDAASVGGALAQVAHEYEERTGTPVALDVDVSLEQPLGRIGTHLVQMTRESLSNVARHANATTCRVSLRRSDGAAVLEIDDDGIGFDVSEAGHGGLGLGNLQKRAESLGGNLSVTSTPGEGTTVHVIVPLTGATS